VILVGWSFGFARCPFDVALDLEVADDVLACLVEFGAGSDFYCVIIELVGACKSRKKKKRQKKITWRRERGGAEVGS
jgi:hypothetical protein